MVHQGPRPAHRRGTAGRPWTRFRDGVVAGVTHCQNPACGKALVRDHPCNHPNHQRMRGCPTYHAYPTLEHPHKLIHGGAVRDRANAQVWCHECNSRGGRGGTARPVAKKQASTSRTW